jgi:hypothetical protein
MCALVNLVLAVDNLQGTLKPDSCNWKPWENRINEY